MMTNDEITKYIDNVEWNDVKDLNHIQNRIYLKDLEKLDDEIENSSYVYLTIFSDCNTDGQDRYLGSDTLSTTKSFMETEYTGSPEKYKQAFDQSLSEYEYRVLCLGVSEDETKILNAESEILKGVDARLDNRFFNGSNRSGGIKKTLHEQFELFDKITNGIENGFKRGTEKIDVLYHMPRAQPRQFDFDENHANKIYKDILGFHGKDLSKHMRPTILLEDFFGPGKHKRGGNTHTIDAVNRPKLKNKIKELEVVFIPKELHSKCTEETIKDILRWDNRNQEKISSKKTNKEERIESCFKIITKYKLSHTDAWVKKRAKSLGASESDWLVIRPKLKEKLDNENTQNDVPPGMELIHYKDKDIKEIEDKHSNKDVTCKVLSTVYSGGTFNGWDYIIRWLDDKKNIKRSLHIPFLHSQKSLKKYADVWPEKEKDIIPIIENLFKSKNKEGHFTWKILDRFRVKQNT